MDDSKLKATPLELEHSVAGPKPGAIDDTIYTTDELAAWLRLTRSTLEKARSNRTGNYPPYLKMGNRRVGYRHIDIINWMQQNLHTNDGKNI